jgi:hypothetical protein
MDYQRFDRPFTIMKQINDMAFQLKLLNSMKIHFVSDVYLMESYHAFTTPRRVHES